MNEQAIDIVIRAKDEATKALGKVKDSIESASVASEKAKKSLLSMESGILGNTNTTAVLNSKLSELKEKLQGIEIGSKEFQKLQNQIKNTENRISDAERGLSKFNGNVERLSETFSTMRNVGAIAFAGLSYGISKTVDSAGQLESALTGLNSIVRGTGNDFGKTQKFLEDFTSDGLVPMQNASTGLKNLLSKGFSLDQATEMMYRFKDSASFGRQAALSLGQAVQSTTEGFKNENSVLTDNGGITQNLSVMIDNYAESLGKKASELTNAERLQAYYNGTMKETQFQVGDAKKASEGYQGQVSRLNAEQLKLVQTIGQVLMPVLSDLYKMITPIIGSIGEWIKQNPELTKYLIITGTAIAGLTTIVGGLGLILPSIITGVNGLSIALKFLTTNPIAITIAALAVLGLALYTVWKNWSEIKVNLILVWEQIKRDIGGIIDGLRDYIYGVFDAIGNFVTGKIDFLKNKAREAAEYLQSILSSYQESSVGQALQSAGSSIYDAVNKERAVGGTVMSGEPVLVGERGPEIIIPKSSSTVVPNNQIGGGANISINFGGVTVRNDGDIQAIARTIEDSLTRKMQLFQKGIA